MKTATAIKHAGSARALAKLLDISPSAISQWGENVPDLRRFELRDIRPEWFDPDQTTVTHQPQADRVGA